MNFSIKDFFSKCEQIRRFLRIWSHLLKKFLMENFIFYPVHYTPEITFCRSAMVAVSYLVHHDFLLQNATTILLQNASGCLLQNAIFL